MHCRARGPTHRLQQSYRKVYMTLREKRSDVIRTHVAKYVDYEAYICDIYNYVKLLIFLAAN